MKKLILILCMSLNYSFANCNDPSSLENVLSCDWSDESTGFGEPPCDHCLTFVAGSASGLPALTSAFYSQGANCTNFITSNGSLGPYGNTIDTYIRNQSVSGRFLNDNLPHITDACPRWSRLNDDQRRHFWVWTFAAIAWDESRCKAGARNPNGTNGVAIGLLQLDEARSARSWRGPNCRAQSVSAANDNLKCGLDIMAELLLGPQGEYQGRGAIFINGRRNTSYWQKLRTSGGGAIADRIKTYPLCQDPSA